MLRWVHPPKNNNFIILRWVGGRVVSWQPLCQGQGHSGIWHNTGYSRVPHKTLLVTTHMSGSPILREFQTESSFETQRSEGQIQ